MGVVWTFLLSSILSPLSLSLWETARYRLKYCLKGPLNPKQPTNQPFQETEVDKYFLHFEKVAENLKWPKEHWTLLLQSVVIGKARKIFTQLSLEQISDYDKVKEFILKGNELVPEAYRQKFRNCRKENDQTHVKFARTKNNYLTDGALKRQ